MRAAAENIVAKWRAAPPGTIHTVHRDMMRAVFDVMSKTMLAGVPDDLLATIEKGNDRYYRSVNWWLLCLMVGLPRWLPRPGRKAMREHEQRLRQAVSKLVLSRRASGMAGDDVLSRLLRTRDPESGMSMPDGLIVDNILAFLVGGSDTTAFALTWTLYLISQSPEWEARMLDEIDRVVGGDPVGSSHVDRLVTVQQVLNESLRLFPTAPVIVRDITEDVVLDGVSIPAGTIGIVPIYAIHRHQSFGTIPIASIRPGSLPAPVRSPPAFVSCPLAPAHASASALRSQLSKRRSCWRHLFAPHTSRSALTLILSPRQGCSCFQKKACRCG
jgi:cytochrome P450